MKLKTFDERTSKDNIETQIDQIKNYLRNLIISLPRIGSIFT